MIRFTNQPISKERPHFTFEEAMEMTKSVARGMPYQVYIDYANLAPFTPKEWLSLLDISRHTMMRMKRTNQRFSKLQTEKILQLALLAREGRREFHSIATFREWLSGHNRSHGKPIPRFLLLHSSFGIQVLIDEVRRGW